MKPIPIQLVKPSAVQYPLIDTPWQNAEREVVAENIVKLSCFRNADRWVPFTWEEYVAFCTHHVSAEEHAILNDFVATVYLAKPLGEQYFFTMKMLDVFAQYVH